MGSIETSYACNTQTKSNEGGQAELVARALVVASRLRGRPVGAAAVVRWRVATWRRQGVSSAVAGTSQVWAKTDIAGFV